MTNKEWLEECKKYDKENVGKIELIQNPLYGEYRQAKATEIIAEELIEFKEIINFALLHHNFMGLRKELIEVFGKEEVKKAEREASLDEKTKK